MLRKITLNSGETSKKIQCKKSQEDFYIKRFSFSATDLYFISISRGAVLAWFKSQPRPQEHQPGQIREIRLILEVRRRLYSHNNPIQERANNLLLELNVGSESNCLPLSPLSWWSVPCLSSVWSSSNDLSLPNRVSLLRGGGTLTVKYFILRD